jgi:hypothetical protein
MESDPNNLPREPATLKRMVQGCWKIDKPARAGSVVAAHAGAVFVDRIWAAAGTVE